MITCKHFKIYLELKLQSGQTYTQVIFLYYKVVCFYVSLSFYNSLDWFLFG